MQGSKTEAPQYLRKQQPLLESLQAPTAAEQVLGDELVQHHLGGGHQVV